MCSVLSLVCYTKIFLVITKEIDIDEYDGGFDDFQMNEDHSEREPQNVRGSFSEDDN